jgi:mRNA-degrading endonuclease toxin of MazEF toxin-antitoxin module
MSLERGQIYFVNLNPVKGREQSGERPVLILSGNPVGKLASNKMQEVEEAVRYVLGL